MKNILRPILVLALLLAALTISAAAAEPTDSGMYGLTVSGCTITPRTADGTAVSADNSNASYSGFYANAEKFDVKCTGLTAGSQYLLLVLSDSGVPTADNIVYINQAAAANDGTLTFDDTNAAFPSKLEKGKTYYVYVVGADKAFTAQTSAIASFKYHQAFTAGDVDGNTSINVNDAMAIINHIVSREVLTGSALLAADATGDGTVNVNDAMEVINYIVGRPQYLV